MKIVQVKVSRLRRHLTEPFSIATGAHRDLDNVLLSIKLSEGIEGFGEAAVATHITGETVEQTLANLRTIATYLKGQQIGHFPTISAYVQSLYGKNKCAAAAVEMALLDAFCCWMKMPLYAFWSTKPKPLASDITIVIGTIDHAERSAQAFYAQGFRTFKIKVGRDMDLDIKRMQAVASRIRHSRIIIDANQGYSSTQAIKFLNSLRKLRIKVDLIEQPVPKDDVEGLARVGRSTGILVCADESVASLTDAMRLINLRSVGAINLKIMKNGILGAVQIAQLARAKGIKLMMGGMMESPLAMTAAAHVAAGLGCFDYIDLDTPFFINNGLANHPCLNKRGCYQMDRIREGIGIKP